MYPVLRAVASLHGLRAVCLAGMTLSGTATPLAAVLQGLTGVTALDLSNTSPSPEAWAALTAALPTLRQLESLDISNNRLWLLSLRGLVRGIAQCTTLRALRMLRTVSIDRPAFGGGAVLARCLPALPRLSELRFGSILGMESGMDAHDFSSGLLSMLHALHAARDLRNLALEYLNIQVRAMHAACDLQ